MPGPQASTGPALFLYTLHHSVATCVWLPVNSGSLGSCPSHINGPGRGYLVISYFPIEAIVVGYSHSSSHPHPPSTQKMGSLSVSCFWIGCFCLSHAHPHHHSGNLAFASFIGVFFWSVQKPPGVVMNVCFVMEPEHVSQKAAAVYCCLGSNQIIKASEIVWRIRSIWWHMYSHDWSIKGLNQIN